MFLLWFALLGRFFGMGPSILFLVFPLLLFWVLWFIYDWQGLIILLSVQSAEHDETLANFIKQNHPAKGGRERKRKNPSPNRKLKKPKGVTKGQSNKFCSRALTSRKKHIKEKNGKKP
jgi:hypothetical protein